MRAAVHHRYGPPPTVRCGVVEVVGRDVSAWRSGDAVFGWCAGAFADYVAVPADQRPAKPAKLTFEQPAAIPMAGSGHARGKAVIAVWEGPS